MPQLRGNEPILGLKNELLVSYKGHEQINPEG
jgi:hypothetical protein